MVKYSWGEIRNYLESVDSPGETPESVRMILSMGEWSDGESKVVRRFGKAEGMILRKLKPVPEELIDLWGISTFRLSLQRIGISCSLRLQELPEISSDQNFPDRTTAVMEACWWILPTAYPDVKLIEAYMEPIPASIGRKGGRVIRIPRRIDL